MSRFGVPLLSLSLFSIFLLSATAVEAASCPVISHTLVKESRGTEVLSLQNYLIEASLLSSDSATGYFGALTENAVKSWQSAHNVVSSGAPATTGYGSVGPRTRMLLMTMCSGETARKIVPIQTMSTFTPKINALLSSTTTFPLTIRNSSDNFVPSSSVLTAAAATPSLTLVSQGKSVGASSQISGGEASKALDGDVNTAWSSGGFAPQWIFFDLGAAYSIGEIKLTVAQYPAGFTVHNIYGSADGNTWTPLTSWNNTWTWDGQVLDYNFPTAQSGVRYVAVVTPSSPSWVAWKEIQVYSAPVTPLSVFCYAAALQGAVTWSATASGGSGGYTYAWGDTLGNTKQTGSTPSWQLTYGSAGVKWAWVMVTDSTGASASNWCSVNVTTTAPPPPPPPTPVAQSAAPASISASCSADGTQATLSWPAVSSATSYDPRFDAINSCPSGWTLWNGLCYINGYQRTSVSFPITASDITHGAWVHSTNAGGTDWTSYAQTSFLCRASLNWNYVASQAIGSTFSMDQVATVLNESGATAPYFSRSNFWIAGVSADGIKIVQTKNAQYPYIGVYHRLAGNLFNTHLAYSKDLKSWTYLSQINSAASMPDIAILPDNSVLYASERNPAGNRPYITVQYFSTLDGFLANPSAPARSFDVPWTAGASADGTPQFGRVTYSGDINNSTIELTYHYFENSVRDRQAVGTLTNFSSWSGGADGTINSTMDARGYSHLGDRDLFQVGDTRYEILEANPNEPSSTNGWDKWRLFLINKNTNEIRQLTPAIPGGAYSIGNPSVSFVTLPNGGNALILTAFIFSQGAASSAAGEHLYIYPI
jgi:peptidoglycan hydrolase-like protein with peptidoglycan-binding domain